MCSPTILSWLSDHRRCGVAAPCIAATQRAPAHRPLQDPQGWTGQFRAHCASAHSASVSLNQLVPATFGEFAGRTGTVNHIARLVSLHSRSHADSRIANPIIASVGSMGTGKTEMLLSLPAALAAHDLSKAWMQDTVPIFITFDGDTPRSIDSEIHDVADAAARRILFAYVGAVGTLAVVLCA